MPLAHPLPVQVNDCKYFRSEMCQQEGLVFLSTHFRPEVFAVSHLAVQGALVAVWYLAGFAIGRLRVRISAWATSHQGLLSLPSLRGR